MRCLECYLKPMAPSTPSLQQLAEVRASFDDALARFEALEKQVGDADWLRRPADGGWSVAECVAHLNLSSAAMHPRVVAAHAEAARLGALGERALKGSLFGRVLAAMVGPVPIVLGLHLGRAKTAPPFVPGSELPRADVVAEYRGWHARWREVLDAAKGLPIDRASLESPFVKGAMYDGFSALRIVARHELRHLVQAERALARLR